ncbi:MAG: L-serine ammonia-lyase, iron-sulfur-dependent subunit beta [Promethearchaeota archaeon]
MKYDSLFDVVGHIMVGPSSSHTMGANRIGYFAQKIFGKQPKFAKIWLHGSFAETYRGHGTDKAIIGGLLGFSPDDERLRLSFRLAKEQNLGFSFKKKDLGLNYHPNSVLLELFNDLDSLSITGSSIGGGNIIIKEIDGIEAGFNGDLSTLVCIFDDNSDIENQINKLITETGFLPNNIHVSMNLQNKKEMVWIEMNNAIPVDLVEKIKKIPESIRVSALNV